MLGKGVENSLLDLLVFLLQTPDFSTVFPFLGELALQKTQSLHAVVLGLGFPAV